jgi:membrane protein DedA with SNARE-associated domain
MEAIIHYSEQFGYIAIFVFLIWCGIGFPLPEDVILIAAGFLIYEEITTVHWTLAVTFTGVILGDIFIYSVGKKFGLDILNHRRFRKILSEKRLVFIEKLFNRYGASIIFFTRFIAFIRAPVYLSAGALGVRFTTFIFYDIIAAALSIPIFVWVGYYFGEEIELAIRYVRDAEYLIIAFALLFVLYIIRLRRNRLKKLQNERRMMKEDRRQADSMIS